MVHPRAQNGVLEQANQGLGTVKATPRSQDSPNFLEGGLPILDVVQHLEGEDRVIAFIREGQGAGVAHHRGTGPGSAPLNHGGVQIEGIHPSGLEILPENAAADTFPAAEVEDAATRNGAPKV